MEDYFIFISILVVITLNFVVYFTIKNRKQERELRNYFKNGLKKNKK